MDHLFTMLHCMHIVTIQYLQVGYFVYSLNNEDKLACAILSQLNCLQLLSLNVTLTFSLLTTPIIDVYSSHTHLLILWFWLNQLRFSYVLQLKV